MPEKPEYGVLCRKCGQFLPVAGIQPEEPVPLEELREKLRLQGWVRILEHSPFGCLYGGQYTTDDVILRP